MIYYNQFIRLYFRINIPYLLNTNYKKKIKGLFAINNVFRKNNLNYNHILIKEYLNKINKKIKKV